MLRCLVATWAMIVGCASANAEGLVVKDLTLIEPSIKEALGPGCLTRAEARSLTGTCEGNPGKPIVSIRLGRQADGTEERVRSGATKMVDLERLCQARSAACTLSALAVAPAVGWITAYPLGDGAGATAIVIRDGDLLTLRCVANDPDSARAIVERLLPVLRAKMIGP